MIASGEAMPGGFWVLGSYPDPSGGPPWAGERSCARSTTIT